MRNPRKSETHFRVKGLKKKLWCNINETEFIARPLPDNWARPIEDFNTYATGGGSWRWAQCTRRWWAASGVVEKHEKLRRELEGLKGITSWGTWRSRMSWRLFSACFDEFVGGTYYYDRTFGAGGPVMKFQIPSGLWRWLICKLKDKLDVLVLVLNSLDKELEYTWRAYMNVFLLLLLGAEHQAWNPLQVPGQAGGHERPMGCGSLLQQWTKSIRFAIGVFKGNRVFVAQTQRAQWIHSKGSFGCVCGSNPGGEDSRVLDCLVLEVTGKPMDLAVKQNVIMQGQGQHAG